jgi:hypothetical protein
MMIIAGRRNPATVSWVSFRSFYGLPCFRDSALRCHALAPNRAVFTHLSLTLT